MDSSYTTKIQKHTQAFRALYAQEFGVELSEQEVLQLSTDLLGLFKLVYRPIPDGDTIGE